MGEALGKDVTAFNIMIRQALERVGDYYYVLPTYSQAKKVIWTGKLSTGQPFLDFIPKEIIRKTNESEMRIELINGSSIRLVGSDSYDSLRGTNPIFIVFSEFAWMHEEVWKTLSPVLNANSGTAIFISTPFGQNALYRMYEIAKVSPDWFCELLTVEDVGDMQLLERIEKERQEGLISEDAIRAEYYCDFYCSSVGAFYARYINTMELEGRICDLNYEPRFPVRCVLDIGVRDSTVILWWQQVGRNIHIIDYYSNHSHGLEHYAGEILSKPYLYAKEKPFWAPHDIVQREFSSGASRLDKAKELGINFAIKTDKNGVRRSAIPAISIMDGIECVRSTLPRIWIDQRRCGDLIKSLRNYRKEYDSKLKVFKQSPRHDNNSHAADCLRYMCLALPLCQRGTTPEELERRYRKAMMGPDANMPAIFRDGLPRY